MTRKLVSLPFGVVLSLLLTQPAAGQSPTLVDVKISGGRIDGTPQGYVQLSSEPSSWVTVYLSSSDPRILVPSSITIAPACPGCSPAIFKGFWIWLGGCDQEPPTVTISATLDGVTKSRTITLGQTYAGCIVVDPADTLHVPDDSATYSNDQLTVRATSTSATATLHVFTWTPGSTSSPPCEGSCYPYIGTLENKGAGQYEGRFYWPNLEKYEIYVASDHGGCFYKQVNRKYPGGQC